MKKMIRVKYMFLSLYCALMVVNSYIFYNMMINYTDGIDILYDIPLSSKWIGYLLIIQFISSFICLAYISFKSVKANRVDD